MSHIATVTECDGCEHQQSNGTCNAYTDPGKWWRYNKHCPLATHLSISAEGKEQGKKRVGQQKHRKEMK